MTLNEREALVAQIEEFKKDAMELWFVPDLAESYKNMDMFSYSIFGSNEVFFMREQARQLWSFWNKAKAQAVPEGCVVVPREPTKEMLKAGIHNYLHQDSIKEKDGSTSISFKFIYQAMIEASESGAEQ